MKSRTKGLNLTKVVLSGKVVRLFSLCRARLSSQLHYDFGLRALKTVLGGVGRLKRELTREQEQEQEQGQGQGQARLDSLEERVVVISALRSLEPTLVPGDVPVFQQALSEAFPRVDVDSLDKESRLMATVREVCAEMGLETEGEAEQWVSKVGQLSRVSSMRCGVILVGPACSGKTTAWRVLLKALDLLERPPRQGVTATSSAGAQCRGGGPLRRASASTSAYHQASVLRLQTITRSPRVPRTRPQLFNILNRPLT